MNEIKLDDEWCCADSLRYSPYAYDGKRELRVNTLSPDNRNYNYFARLADVRNYGRIPMIGDKLRGVPEDASKEYKEMVENYGSDGHSYSYYTFRELITGENLDGKVTISGFVSPETVKYYEECGEMPEEYAYCQGTSNRTWKFMEWSINISEFYPLDDLMEAYDDILKHFFYVEKPTDDMKVRNPGWAERQLKQYKEKFEEYLDKTRMCFFFDN